MKQVITASLRFLLLATIFLGGVYTLGVTGIGQLLFSHQANGSIVERGGKTVGSELIGQPFTEAAYFQGRPTKVSQLSPYGKAQKQLIADRSKALLAENPTEKTVPIDLVTASGSGLDPHISLEAATFQVGRIAEARKLTKNQINAIIEEQTENDLFSNRHFVNVLKLNIALDELEI